MATVGGGACLAPAAPGTGRNPSDPAGAVQSRNEHASRSLLQRPIEARIRPAAAVRDCSRPPGGSGTRCQRAPRSEEHTSELQSLRHLVCRLLLEKKKKKTSQSCATTKR